MADLEMEKTYSGFERFMFFVTPILFTLVLLGVLLTLFNIDLRNKVLEIGNGIPLVGKLLPDAPAAADSGDPNTAEQQLRETNTAAKIKELELLLAAKDNELKKALEERKTDEATVADLRAQLEELKKIGEKEQLDDAQYQAHIAGLAGTYAQLAPSKAAPILQNMTMEEMVLILSAMPQPDVVQILEKMDPVKAADATMMMKDIVPAKDRQLAALQSRLKKQQEAPASSGTFLDREQLAATFEAMTPTSASDLLLKMAGVNPAKTLQVLRAVNDESRSRILDAMSAANKDITAQLVSKLMSGK